MSACFATKLAHPVLLVSCLVVSACGDDDGTTPDAALAADSAMATDAAGTVDSAMEPDAAGSYDATIGPDADPNACHGLGFGGAVLTLEQVTSLPDMTGGTIPTGQYDAVAFKMGTTAITGTYQGSWYFESASTLQVIEQLALNGAPPPSPTPRTMSYSAEGTSLTRTRTCGGDTTLMNEYRVWTDGPDTFLDVRNDILMFTFKKR